MRPSWGGGEKNLEEVYYVGAVCQREAREGAWCLAAARCSAVRPSWSTAAWVRSREQVGQGSARWCGSVGVWCWVCGARAREQPLHTGRKGGRQGGRVGLC